MTRDELIERLILLEQRGKLTEEEVLQIIRLFDAGKLKATDLALALSLSAPGAITSALALEAARNSIAGRVLVERISRSGKRKLTIRVVDEYTDRVFGIVNDYTKRFSVRNMHRKLLF